MELDLQVKVEETFSSFVSELYDHHQDICDVKFVLRRRKGQGNEEAVVDVVRAHNVVVLCHSQSPRLQHLYEQNKERRDFEFCVRIEVKVDVSVTALQLFVKCLYGKLKGKICDIVLLKDLLELLHHFQVPYSFIKDNLPLKPSSILAVSERYLDQSVRSATPTKILKRC